MNSWAPTATPPGLTCLTVTGKPWRTHPNGTVLQVNSTSGGFSFGTTRYPATSELIPWTSTATNPAYSCRNGDVYVSGTIVGHMTIASDNYIYVTDDLLYKDRTKDMLGLVPLNALWICNPIIKTGTTCSPVYAYKTGNDLEIDAALLSVKHTVQVQNYDGGVNSKTGLGNKGNLTIFGALAQKFRGTVATSNGTSRPGDRVFEELPVRHALPQHGAAEVPDPGVDDLQGEPVLRHQDRRTSRMGALAPDVRRCPDPRRPGGSDRSRDRLLPQRGGLSRACRHVGGAPAFGVPELRA